MSRSRLLLACCLILAAGCDGGDSSGTGNLNPYANNTVNYNAPPPPGSMRPTRPGQSGSMVGDDDEELPPIVVPEAGYAAEMGVPLPFLDYLRFVRQSTEMLQEMTQIHAQVSDSGDADPYQARWGELTAAHTKLVRHVVDSAYPTAELAQDLQQTALPKLQEALDQAAAVMKEYDDLKGGLAQPYAQAQTIFDHLSKKLSPESIAGNPVDE